MGEDAGQQIFTLREICERFRSKNGNRYLFTEADIGRLIDSLAPGLRDEKQHILPTGQKISKKY